MQFCEKSQIGEFISHNSEKKVAITFFIFYSVAETNFHSLLCKNVTFNSPCNNLLKFYQFVCCYALPVSLEGLVFLVLQSCPSGPSDDKDYRKYDV